MPDPAHLTSGLRRASSLHCASWARKVTVMFNRTSLKSLVIAAGIAGLIVIATAGRAEAQVGTGGTLGIGVGTGGTTGSTTFAAGDFFTTIQQQTNPPANLTTFELSRFFNQAACDCSTPVNIFIALLASGIAKRTT